MCANHNSKYNIDVKKTLQVKKHNSKTENTTVRQKTQQQVGKHDWKFQNHNNINQKSHQNFVNSVNNSGKCVAVYADRKFPLLYNAI